MFWVSFPRFASFGSVSRAFASFGSVSRVLRVLGQFSALLRVLGQFSEFWVLERHCFIRFFSNGIESTRNRSSLRYFEERISHVNAARQKD